MSDKSVPVPTGAAPGPFSGHFNKESTRRSFAWQELPPDETHDPELFRGVIVRRIMAYLIDFLIVVGLYIVVTPVLWLVSLLTLGLLAPLSVIIATLIPMAYHTATIGGPRNATVGQLIMRLEVRRWDGGRPGYVQAGVQTILFYLSLGSGILLLGFLLALFDARRRCLHDLLSGTVLVNSDRVDIL
ncbi:MAG: RDD family protein [Alphaproteobacteria bacterium]|nr:RDD family protein [Alphaproteobacteria bacterium]